MAPKRKRQAAAATHPSNSPPPLPENVSSSPPSTPIAGRRLWKKDFDESKAKWAKGKGELVGCAGMIGVIERFKSGDGDDSARFRLSYEDVEGQAAQITVDMVFQSVDRYPTAYSILLFSDDSLSRRAEKALTRFNDIYEMRIPELIARVLAALQGDEDADGGQLLEDDSEQEEVPDLDEESEDSKVESFHLRPETIGKLDWSDLKTHFEQAKSMGYRPGLTQVSDFWVISLSIPLKNLPIDPNMLAAWDDALVEAWKEDQRFTLMVGLNSYPPNPDQMRYWLGFDKNYKPSPADILATTRGQGLPSFYLSSALLGFLKDFSRVYKIRTTFDVDWNTADDFGMDEEEARQVFQNGHTPQSKGPHDMQDPVNLGYDRNIPLCAFWWTLRRFVGAAKYCLNCGREVAIPSVRPYVCDKPLCLYGFMSLGLGPSVEHVITHHPAVVDLLLTFAHAAATSSARMDLPVLLHIEVPEPFGLPQATLLDDMPATDQRRAIAWLIDQLPRVSQIKTHLDGGSTLAKLPTCSGSIGILRWVIGSCRAYLRELKWGEGVLGGTAETAQPVTNIRQFAFVVGSPEQETNFKQEITKAQANNARLEEFPTMLAFHGSGNDRWHNILRNGLDFQETTNGRAYGHGVYFASDYSTSASYSRIRPGVSQRMNMDWKISSAIALVELVNVPSTFVSTHPYYVVSQTKQIKPFLLLVSGLNEDHTTVPANTTVQSGELFRHDPQLARPTTYSQQPVRVNMPQKLIRTTYIDDDEDDETDDKILNPTPPVRLFQPSPATRVARLQLMPPPTSTSTSATRTLSRELKTVIEAQATGSLPFYVDPDNDSLYCWVLELHEFPESQLKREMKQKAIDSVIAELRFPSTYPHSPPFMRILHPRFLPFAQGGGGNITAGGSVCNEVLTSTGWNPAFVVEAIIRDIMVNMVEAEPPARLDMRRYDTPYGLYEAMEAYKRVALQHNWEIPKDFDRMAA